LVWIPRRERGIAMKSDPMSKLSASLVVLLMALSALVIVPAGFEGQSSSTKNIYVPVLSGGSPVTNANVNLTDVHTGAVIAANYKPSKAAYAVEGAPSGYYRVDVVQEDYYDKLDASEFRFDATSNYTTSVVQLTSFPTKQWVWNITVRDPTNYIIVGALVGFYDPIAKEFVAKGTTNEFGYAGVSMFNSAVLGDVDLVIVKKGFETYVEQVVVTSSTTRTINLVKSKVVSSYVTLGSETVSNVVAYLINTDSAVPWVKRVQKSYSAAMSFDAYPGDFVLVVDGDGAAAHVQTLTVAGSDVDLTISLSVQPQRTELIDITYGANFRTFSLNVNTTWSFDDAYPGLMFNDMGSLRMQVDLTMGNGDGVLSSTEVNDFKALIQTYGSQYVTSDKLLMVNDTSYLSSGTITGYVNDIASGPVVNSTGVEYMYACAYTASTLDLGASFYESTVSVNYDTASANYSYTIALVSGYERVFNTSFGGTIGGYEEVTIDPSTGVGSWVSIAMDIEESETPSALAGIIPEANAAYAVYDDLNITKYIVNVSANVTFNGGISVDPNGNPLTYTWNFGDGSSDVTTTNKTVVHKYLTAAAERTVNLTIKDVADRLNWTDLKVVCDDLEPSPVITAKDRTLNTTDNSVSVNEREMLIVNATDSADDVATVGDGLGIIDWVQFDYGDGNSSDRIAWNNTEQNASHSYANSGLYTLVLNVMDVVGHSKNTTLTVKVNDTTKPTATFTYKNETGGSNLIENRTVVFDASSSYDNLDNISLLKFEWNFGDGSNWENYTGLAGTNVTHNYTHVAQFHVALNVTDLAGNWQKTPKTINILEGPRPKLKIERVYYSPGNFSEGKQGYILVNLTNTGSRPASGVVVTFWVVRTDGTEKILGTAMSSGGQMYNGTSAVTVVEVGGKVQIKFPVSFGTKGTYTIKVNVTCSDQLAVARYTASGDQALIVKEAGWKKPLLWGGVAAVIILVPLALYFRGRLSKREKKGPRREKKSEEGQ
jgi:PKD repeat protein